MPNRTIKDTIWISDKLAALSLPAGHAAVIMPEADQGRLAYAYMAVPLQDDWGCFELNPPVIRFHCFSRFEQPPPVQQVTLWLQLYNHHGLLFVWEEETKAWAYLTGKEAGRLPEPSRRHKRKTPSLGHKEKLPCEQWPEVEQYLSTYKELQETTTGLLSGYKVVQAASASPQTPTTRPQTPTTRLPPVRAGADPDPEPEPDQEHEPDPSVERAALRKHLVDGIYRNHLFDYCDNRYRSCEANGKKGLALLGRELTAKCANLLLVNRGQKELVSVGVEGLVDAAWAGVASGLPIVAKLKDYEARKRQLVGHVINCVVDAAVPMVKETPKER